MFMKFLRLVCLSSFVALVVALAVPSAAYAEGFISPGLGVAFGNGAAAGRANFVLEVGWVSREPLGVELDTTIAPDFCDNKGVSTGITTVMGSVMILGGRSGRYVRRFRGGGAVDNDQNHRQELCAHQDEQARRVEERENQEQHRMNGVTRRHHHRARLL